MSLTVTENEQLAVLDEVSVAVQVTVVVPLQVPWLGTVPVLGALFRSSAYQNQESDLVIIVTPHLVRPARPGERLRTPLDSSRPATDPEFFGLGQAEITKPMARRLKGSPDGRPPATGHILDVAKGADYAAK